MRIHIESSQGQGKTTLVNDFLKNWPTYKKSKESYRDLIKSGEITNLNKTVTQDSQWKILQALIADQKGLYRRDNVIFDRGTLSNLVYSIWSAQKGDSDIDDKFIEKCIPLVREAMKDVDIIFFIPLTNAVVEQRKNREADPLYVKEIDNIFKAIAQQHVKGQSAFFPKDDAPPIIEIFGTPEQRIEMIKFYLDKDGNAVDETQSMITPEALKSMEDLIKDQMLQMEVDKKVLEKRQIITDSLNKKGLK